MIAKEITVTIGGTINLGNYENYRVDVSVTAEMEAFPNVYDIDDRVRELSGIVRKLVREEVAKLESRNTRGWLRDTDLKQEKVPVSDAPDLPGGDETFTDNTWKQS